MALTVKKIEIWNVVVENKPGALAKVLEPLAEAGADLELVMTTSIPGEDGSASVGVFPIKGGKVMSAARSAGFEPAASMPSLLVSGENRVGLGRQMSEALGGAGINIGVAVAQVVGENFAALFGFGVQEDAARAATVLRKVTAPSAKPSAKTTAGKLPAKPREKARATAKPRGVSAARRGR